MKKKKNILFVGGFNTNIKGGGTGGQITACNSLINSSIKECYNFILLDSSSKIIPPPHIFFRAFHALIRLLRFTYSLFFKKIDTVLIFSADGVSFIEKGVMAIIAKGLSKKVIFSPRSGILLDDYEKSSFMKWFMPFVINRSNHIVCQGTLWKNFFQKISNNFNNEKFVVIHNWINTSYFIDYEYTTNKNKPLLITYIGWLEKFKGTVDLIEALHILNKKKISFHCQIYGSGSLQNKIESLILKYQLEQKVKLMGWANKKTKMEVLQNADIYVLPSHTEGFPNSLLEAMAAERPVISTNVGAVEDLLLHKENGVLVPPKKPEKLSQEIEFLLKDESARAYLAKNAKKTVEESFIIDIAVEKFKKIL